MATTQNNSLLHRQFAESNDEYYTLFEDVEEELNLWSNELTGKRILCPCDTEKSAFIQYLCANYDHVSFSSADFRLNHKETYNGEPCISRDLWEEAEVVITNPPFSLQRAFVTQCLDTNKSFLILMNNVSTVRDVRFQRQYWFGKSGLRSERHFSTQSGSRKQVGLVNWVQNIAPQEARGVRSHKAQYLDEENENWEWDDDHNFKVYDCRHGHLPNKFDKGLFRVSFLAYLDPEKVRLLPRTQTKKIILKSKELFERLYLQQVKVRERSERDEL